MDRDARKVFTQINIKNKMIYHDGELYWRFGHGRWAQGDIIGVTPKKGYKFVRLYGYFLLIHELVWIWHHGYLPEKGLKFIDGDHLNTRIENLSAVPLCNKIGVSFL